MKKVLSVLLALIIFICGNFGLQIQAQAALNLTPIALNYTVKDVDVGDTFTLRATVPQDSMGTLDWSSSNTSVATVADSGTVTGHQLGTAVITATYTTAGGNIGRAMCTVYVTVADGLYYIKNAYSDLCMLADGSRITIQPQQTEINGRNRQLWKIEHESQGQYSIYPIWDTSLALTSDDGNYVAIGAPESEACWGIAQGTGGYSIQYLGNGDQTAKPVVASTPGSLVYLGQWQDSLSCHWELEEAAGLFVRNTETNKLHDTDETIYIDYGERYFLTDIGLEVEIYGSLLHRECVSSDTSAVKVLDYDEIEAVGCGFSEITFRASISGCVYSVSCILFSQGINYSMINLDNTQDELTSQFDYHMGSMFSGYGQCDGGVSKEATKEEFLNQLLSSNYFCVVAHGNLDNQLLLSDGEVLVRADFESIPQEQFAGVELVILNCCDVAHTSGNSLADILLDKGVDVVIGFTGNIERETSLYWTEWFTYYLVVGYSVGEAIEQANESLNAKYANKTAENGEPYNPCISLIIDGLNRSLLTDVWDMVLFPQS